MDESPNTNIPITVSTEESIPKLKKSSNQFSPVGNFEEINTFVNSIVEELFQKKNLIDRHSSLMKNLKEKRQKWICYCGKQYSTYPALHLHKKNKHKNEPLQYTKPKKIKKIGRPKTKKVQTNWEERMIQIFQEINNQGIIIHEIIKSQRLSTLELDINIKAEQLCQEFINFFYKKQYIGIIWLFIFYLRKIVHSSEQVLALWTNHQDSLFQATQMIRQLFKINENQFKIRGQFLMKMFEIFVDWIETEEMRGEEEK